MDQHELMMEVYGFLEYMGIDSEGVPEIYFQIAEHFYNLGINGY